MRFQERSGAVLGGQGRPRYHRMCLAAAEGMSLEKRFVSGNRANRKLDYSPQLQSAGLSAKLAGFPRSEH